MWYFHSNSFDEDTFPVVDTDTNINNIGNRYFLFEGILTKYAK